MQHCNNVVTPGRNRETILAIILTEARKRDRFSPCSNASFFCQLTSLSAEIQRSCLHNSFTWQPPPNRKLESSKIASYAPFIFSLHRAMGYCCTTGSADTTGSPQIQQAWALMNATKTRHRGEFNDSGRRNSSRPYDTITRAIS